MLTVEAKVFTSDRSPELTLFTVKDHSLVLCFQHIHICSLGHVALSSFPVYLTELMGNKDYSSPHIRAFYLPPITLLLH